MTASLREPAPRGFGIEHVRPVPGGALLLCDCGTVTGIALSIAPDVLGTVELAFTCDGCLTVHWFYVRVTVPDESENESGQ